MYLGSFRRWRANNGKGNDSATPHTSAQWDPNRRTRSPSDPHPSHECQTITVTCRMYNLYSHPLHENRYQRQWNNRNSHGFSSSHFLAAMSALFRKPPRPPLSLLSFVSRCPPHSVRVHNIRRVSQPKSVFAERTPASGTKRRASYSSSRH